ncbi:MAG: DUF5682 family protein [Chitinophagales bacterium]|nr:DUF5682 family protein [Chitinophagales bacterium]
MYKIFGIRHHGPGSASSLLKALHDMEPDCILVEAPADAEPAMAYMLHPELIPPVAMLVYDDKDVSKAAYLPFATFSPEWQAIQFGLAQGSEVRFMDLPMSLQFKLEERKGQLKMEMPDEREAPIVRDPMGYIARLAGYTDSERWWEATFEQTENEANVFEAILQLNEALRAELNRHETPLTRLREAYMRKILRKAIKDGYEKIAVVCGAWHAPVLHHLNRFTQKNDNALLKGMKKVKTSVTWIPWTYRQLAFQSGYRSGVVSPAWYELLFDNRVDVVANWMSKAAVLLRQAGMDASAAHAVEATRLAMTLAALRQQPIPGLPEMKEAAIAVFCGGHETPWQLIADELVIGHKVGEVPGDIPQAALQKDMETRIRSARLTKFYKSSEPQTRTLDLRKPSNLDASHLLHQLRVIDIYFGTTLENSETELGTFKEHWRLHWQPDFLLKLISAGMWGNTVRDAASNKLVKTANDEIALEKLVQLAGSALLGGMPETFSTLSKRIEDAAAITKDVYSLMEALPTLVEIVRYGDTRQTDIDSVQVLIHQLIPRVAVGLPGAVMNIDEEWGRSWFQLIVKNNHAIGLLNSKDYQKKWNEALEKLMENKAAQPLLRGLACRMLFDRAILSKGKVAREMSFVLSDTVVMDAALWMEGFLYGSGLLLVHNPSLWYILDDWISGIPDISFPELLPVLRRAFSNFTGPERAKLLSLTRQAPGEMTTKVPTTDFNQQRAKLPLPTLKLLLGLE